jgi:hypothetical protein
MDLRTQPAADPHRSLHSDTGGLSGEHPGRSRNPLTKIVGLGWLEFEKPDLALAERLLSNFGFAVADRTPEALVLRGHRAGTPSLVVRRGAGFPVRWARVRRRRRGGPGPASPRHEREFPAVPRRLRGRPDLVPGHFRHRPHRHRLAGSRLPWWWTRLLLGIAKLVFGTWRCPGNGRRRPW